MKRLALWILAAAIAAMLLVNTAASAEASTSAVWGEVTGDSVRVRAGASPNHRIIGLVNSGDRVVVLGQENGWARIQASAETPVWLSSRYVTNDGVVTGSRVNLRIEPRAAHTPLGQVVEGDRVRVLESQDGWHRIVPPAGISVYIHGDYVRTGGAVSDRDFAAWVGGTVPASSQPEPVAAVEMPRDNREQEAFAELLERFDGVMAGQDASVEITRDSLEAVARLAHEFDAFADAAQTSALGSDAAHHARLLRTTHAMMLTAWEEAQRARTSAEQAAAEAEAIRRRAEEQARQAEADARAREAQSRQARQERLLSRLLYEEPNDYTAVGQVVDSRDAEGRRIYLLKIEGQVTYELWLSPATAGVDLRALWQRTVGICGRVLTIDGHRHVVLLCDRIDEQG